MKPLLSRKPALHARPGVAKAKEQYRQAHARAVRVMLREVEMRDLAQQHLVTISKSRETSA